MKPIGGIYIMKGGEQKMKITRIVCTGLVTGVAAISFAGAAFADSNNADLGVTGPNSTSNVTINDVNNFRVSNSNSIVVVNDSTQIGMSGSASVDGNTNGGSANTGAVSNTNTTSTSININNGGSGHQGCSIGCVPIVPVVPVTPVANGGGVGGGSLPFGGKGGGMLPLTGPSDIVDVSALRALYQPISAEAPTQNNVLNKTQGIQAGLLLGALLLTLAGTIGSVMFATKRTAKQ